MKGLPSMGLEAAGIYEISVSEHSHGLVSKQRTPKSNKWCSVFPLFICLSVCLCLSLPVSVCLCLSLSVCLSLISIHPSNPALSTYLFIHLSGLNPRTQAKSQENGQEHRGPGKFLPGLGEAKDGRPLALETEASSATAPEVEKEASAVSHGWDPEHRLVRLEESS